MHCLSRHIVRVMLNLVFMTQCWPFYVFSSKNYRNVFTMHDVFRASYCPNTTPEETFFAWDTENDPRRPPITPSEPCPNGCVGQSSLHSASLPTEVIRCPYGWHPIGPLCSTLSLVAPYTQCPLDARRFMAGPGNPVFPVKEQPGVCQRVDTMGVSLECPATFTPTTPLDSTTETVLECRRTQVFPFVFLDNSTTLAVPAEGPPTERVCPSGSVPRAEEGGCVAVMRLPPEPTCPEGYQLSSTIVDPYAFYGKQAVECKRQTLVKGKLWCPSGYEISGHPYPDVFFGGVIPSDIIALEQSATFTSTKEAFLLLRSGWRNIANFTPLDEQVVCFQVLVTAASNCDDLECTTPSLTALRHILINWSYRQLLTDPDYIVHLAIPSGRDFKMTSSGLRRQH